MIELVLSATIAYLLGCFSAGFFICKLCKQIDIREFGSGNAGSTNVVRTLGWRYGLLTLALDLLKGVAAVLIGRWLAGEYGGLLAGVMAVAGHNWPVFLSFRGGKGAATTLGVALVIDPLISLYVVIIFVVVVAITRFVSLGAILAVIGYAIMLVTMHSDTLPSVAFAAFMCVTLLFQHRENIQRLLQGNERRISFKRHSGGIKGKRADNGGVSQ